MKTRLARDRPRAVAMLFLCAKIAHAKKNKQIRLATVGRFLGPALVGFEGEVTFRLLMFALQLLLFEGLWTSHGLSVPRGLV